MAGRQSGQTFTIRGQERAGTKEQRTSPAFDERCKGCLDLAVAPGIENDQLPPEQLRRVMHVSSLSLGTRVTRTHEHANSSGLGYHLVKQFQSFLSYVAYPGYTRDIA